MIYDIFFSKLCNNHISQIDFRQYIKLSNLSNKHFKPIKKYRRIIYNKLLLALLFIVAACSQEKSSISREYPLNNNWNVVVE